MDEETNGIATEANRLYWSSDRSVAEVAELLNLSRRALYSLIQPLPAEGTCEVCGSRLSYANRSARDAGRASCAPCLAAADPAAGAAPVPRRRTATGAEGEDAADEHAGADERLEDASLRRRAVQLGGAAIVGAIVGAGVTILTTRD